MLDGLDHVQLAMPLGGEERARAYFGGMLGLAELEKPATLAGWGGAWFGMPGRAPDLSRRRGAVPAGREGASGVCVRGAGRTGAEARRGWSSGAVG